MDPYLTPGMSVETHIVAADAEIADLGRDPKVVWEMHLRAALTNQRHVTAAALDRVLLRRGLAPADVALIVQEVLGLWPVARPPRPGS